MKVSFYQFVLRYRGGSHMDGKHRFADRVFSLHDFPKGTNDFYELSNYIEMQADEDMPASIFDELWEEYQARR
ncbi:YozE family protein [Chryseomicrobium sp. FSL W7-1435]|uniref:YozE family protein n=1 Tax=Chryseomicrobium sp. FSL W7-1435 TaxID=2921704 RepID=UPI003159B32A